MLIAVDALRQALAGQAGPAPALLDVRWELAGPPGRDAYVEGHIPGAVFVDLDTELAGPPGDGGRHPLPAAEDFEAAMRAADVSGERPVVVYDAGNAIAAARAWWLLRYFGHSRVTVLDGGLAAWLSAGLEVERGAGPPARLEAERGAGPRAGLQAERGAGPPAGAVQRGDFAARPGGMPLLDAHGAATVARAGVLLDARAPERYQGEHEPIDPVAGHIPGAVNLPSVSLVDTSGRFLDAGALRARFAGAGVRDGVEVGAYCGSGVTAAHAVLALEVAGVPAALYVGSWSEWIRDRGRPVATGQ